MRAGPRSIPDVGALAERQWEPRVLQLTTQAEPRSVACGDARVTVSTEPLTVRIEAEAGRLVQLLRIDQKTGALSFRLGDGPVLGLGEGGPQFDRRGSVDRMRSGQGGYRLRTHGGRVPIPWLIGTSGWAMFVHQPTGSFDLSGAEGRFIPAGPESSLPLDIFVVIDREPARIMAEYARLTGLPEDAPALVVRLPAVASDPGRARGGALHRPNLPRKAAAMRRAHLPRHRLLPVGLEHRAWVVYLQPQGVPRSEGNDRRAARDCTST